MGFLFYFGGYLLIDWALHVKERTSWMIGGVAQVVERSLSMREVRGSIPRISKNLFVLNDSCCKGYNLRTAKL